MTETFRNPQEEAQYRGHLEYFDRNAHLVVDGTRYALSEADLEELAMAGRYYLFIPGDLNSSVFASTVRMARSKFRPQLPRAQIIALCAATLKTSVAAVEPSLSWTPNHT